MTGRLDKVDLPSDLLLLILQRRDNTPTLAALYSDVLAVDSGPFAFDSPYGDSEDFLEDIRTFEHIGFLELDGSLARLTAVELTERGERMAEILEDCLTEDQQAAFAEVMIA